MSSSNIREALEAWFQSVDANRTGRVTKREAKKGGLPKTSKITASSLRLADVLTLIERSPDTYSSFLSSVQAKYKAKSFGRAYCLATHTYQPAGSGSGQLGFRKNAVMVIESKHDRGWWRGWVVRGGDGSVIDSKDKKIGYFPSAYTKLCNAPSVRLASSSPTPSTAASAAVGTTPAANPFTSQLKPGHLPGASQLVAAAAVDHAEACMVKGVSIATARTWAAQPDVARAIVKNIGTVGPVSVKTIAILRTLLNIMGSSQEGKDGAESAGALRSPGRLALLRSLGTNTALLGIGGNSTASDKDRASIAETVFETLLYTHPLGAENVKAAKGFVARTAAELFPSDEKKSAEVSQTGALGLASLIILATSDAGSGLSASARAERTRQSPEMASNLGDIFLTFLVDNGAGQEPARELAAVLLALARGVMASEAYRKAAIATAQKSAPEAFLHAQCLQRIMKWPANCKTESALQGPAFLRVLDEADGCDEDAVGFVKSVVSRFCFLDGDVRLPVGAADLGGGAGKIKKGLSVLREALSSEEEAKGWEKAVRLGGGVLRALVSLVVTDDAKLTASGVPEAAVYVLSELAGRNPRPAVAFIAPNASILLKRATEMLPKLRTALSDEREQLNAEHRKAFDAELQFTGDPTTRAAIVRKRELSLDRVLGTFRVCCMCMLYADKASLKAFARDRTLVRSLAASVCDYTEFPYPELSGLLPKLLVLLDQIDVSKSALEQCVTHRNRAAVSEAIARCFNKPEKDIELHVVRFVMEVYDSGNERFFAASDQKCLFQILISHLESLEYELGDAVLLALIECYRAMVEWEGYSQERFYHEEGEAQIETVLSNITRSSNLDYTREGSPAHTLYVKALQVSQLLKSL